MKNFIRHFKSAIVIFIFLLIANGFVSIGFAQQTVLMTESFEAGNGAVPPPGWVIQQVTGTVLGISFMTSSTYPTISTAYDGTRFVKYNSFNITAGSTRLKSTTALSTVNKSFVMVDFAWYEDPGYPTSADRVEVQWSTNDTTWTTAGTFNRYNAVAGWKIKNVILPTGANNQTALYVAFLFTSAYGNNCDIDLVHVTAGPAAPPSFVTIGTGTTSSNYPYTTYWMGGRTQALYTAAELIAAGATTGNLFSVGFNVITNSTQLMNGFNVKMGLTTATTITAYVNGLTSYYATPYAVPGTGWQDITLTTPFAWNGTSNVIVEICFANTSYTTYSYVNAHAATSNIQGHYADTQTECAVATMNNPTLRPNIRFGAPPITPGALIGYVRDVNTLAPIAGAIVIVGDKRDTSKSNGSYIIYNLLPGAVTANCIASGYLGGSGNATIVSGTTTSLDIFLSPGPRVGGIITDASTGAPIVGATVTVAGSYQTMSVSGGAYLTPPLSISGTQSVMIGKTGYETFIATATLVPNTTTTLDAALLPTAVQPGSLTAALNGTPATAVYLNWIVPQGMYQVIYDDGIQDNFAIWAVANNLNAVKFTPAGLPSKLIGGKVNLGIAANYPSNALPLTAFTMLACKADGAGGLPGTIIDSVMVTPSGFGWADFSFASPITINSGDFYLVMKQGGSPPHAAGIGVDLTTNKFRSYSCFVTGGAPWVPESGNFMIRAIIQGTGGPLLGDNSTANKELITASSVEGLIYQSPVATVSGYEGVARTEPFDWSAMQNTNFAPQITAPVVAKQPATDEGVGSNIVGVVIPTEAPVSVLYDNGPMITSTGTGFGGADESMVQAPLTGFGMNFNHATYIRVADDFSLSGNSYNVTSIEFYGYQTGSTTTSTFTAAYCRILNGNPSLPGSTVVWGDTTTNRLSSTSFTNIYRVSVTLNNQRPIMKIVINTPGLTLPAGNYWIEFATLGSLASGPWCPYVTINNTPTTGNALYYGGTTAGYSAITSGTPTAYAQGIPFIINGTQASPSNISYQVWRLMQGLEGIPTGWTSIWTGNATSTVDNTWHVLPSGAYRWAVKAIYSPPGQRPSAPTFSNVIGKDWLANVTVNVSLNCADDPLIGSVVKLVNNNYPDTAYMATTDASGKAIFTQVWKGNYTLSVFRLNYNSYSQALDIMGSLIVTPNPIILLQTNNPPTNLSVNNQNLKATWNPAKSDFYQLDENFDGGFTTNEWVVSGGANWQISTTLGNPAPSAMFSYTPAVTDYHQYLTSKSLAGVHAPQMKLIYDIYLDNFGTTTLNELAVELWNGATWTALKTYNNMGGNIPWTTEAIDITAQTHNPAFKIRFHASGGNSVDLINWNIDNVKVISSNEPGGGNSCLNGYGVFLNNIQIGFTMDTNYQIQPNQVVYGQPYNFCIKAAYQSGYSLPICVNFSSNFLYPPTSLVATAIQSTAYLTWNKPQIMGDAPQILSITPKAVDPNSIADIAPYDIVTTKPANVDNADALWDLKFSWAAATNQETGVVCIGDFIYTSSWSLSGGGTNWFHKYSKTTGAMIEQFDIPGLTTCRDFAFDGVNAYATGYTNTISKLNLGAHTVVSTLVTSGVGNIRHIAYDPVNNGFWVGDWTTISLVDATTGAVVATGPALLNAYGSAYDPDPAGPFIWVHAQNGTPLDELQQFKITGTTLTATGVVMNVGTLAGFPSGGSAGGLETVTQAGKFCLLGAVQNLNWIFAVELRDSIGETPPGLIGYNIYRDNTLISSRPHPDSTTFYDYTLNPGIYRYDVSAIYDLTIYGFPGQIGESAKDGPDTLIIGLKTQQIAITEGWNMISFNVVPDTLDLLNILQPLVNSNNLVKVIDEAGNIIQYFPWGWVNNIGDMAITDGYYIKVNSDDTLAVSGFTAYTPCIIPLIAGWNIIGYPPYLQQDALVAVQQLISSGELVKVIDESGNIIQNLPWGWVNNIGNFKPGEGYYINVSAACTLTLNNTSSKLPIVIPAKISEPTHFANCFTRNPYMPMAFGIVVGLSDNEGIEPGDEFAVFDGAICVGSIVVTKDMGNHVMIAGSADDPTTINIDGFTEGDKITFRFWDRSRNIEYENCAVNYIEGNQTFAQKGTYIGEIDLFTGADETLSSANTYLLQNTPNPFNGFTEIKYGIGRDGKVKLTIFNAMGILMNTIIDEFQKKGDHLVTFNSADLPSGIYYYQLEVSGYENRIVKTEKMIVTKY